MTVGGDAAGARLAAAVTLFLALLVRGARLVGGVTALLDHTTIHRQSKTYNLDLKYLQYDVNFVLHRRTVCEEGRETTYSFGISGLGECEGESLPVTKIP